MVQCHANHLNFRGGHNGDHDDSFAITEEDYEKDIEVIVEEQKEVKSGCDANNDGIPPNNKLLGILSNEL